MASTNKKQKKNKKIKQNKYTQHKYEKQESAYTERSQLNISTKYLNHPKYTKIYKSL